MLCYIFLAKLDQSHIEHFMQAALTGVFIFVNDNVVVRKEDDNGSVDNVVASVLDVLSVTLGDSCLHTNARMACFCGFLT